MNENYEESELDAFKRFNAELREKVERYEAGADATPVDVAAAGTSGQLWHKMLQADEAGRFRLLNGLLSNMEAASACFLQDHAGRIGELQGILNAAEETLADAVGLEGHDYDLAQLVAAAHALRSALVESATPPQTVLSSIENVEWPQERDVATKINEQLKTAGIDLRSLCGYEWTDEGATPCPRNKGAEHVCGQANPLHTQSHVCEQCGATLNHEQAEALQLAQDGATVQDNVERAVRDA